MENRLSRSSTIQQYSSMFSRREKRGASDDKVSGCCSSPTASPLLAKWGGWQKIHSQRFTWEGELQLSWPMLPLIDCSSTTLPKYIDSPTENSSSCQNSSLKNSTQKQQNETPAESECVWCFWIYLMWFHFLSKVAFHGLKIVAKTAWVSEPQQSSSLNKHTVDCLFSCLSSWTRFAGLVTARPLQYTPNLTPNQPLNKITLYSKL